SVRQDRGWHDGLLALRRRERKPVVQRVLGRRGLQVSYRHKYSSPAWNTWEAFNDAIRTAGCSETSQATAAGDRGVYDVVGNVGEWEASCLGTGQFATCRIRGSSYLFDDYTTDLATCQADSIAIWSLRMGDVGFRCCAP